MEIKAILIWEPSAGVGGDSISGDAATRHRAQEVFHPPVGTKDTPLGANKREGDRTASRLTLPVFGA